MNCRKSWIEMDKCDEHEWMTALAIMGDWQKGGAHLDELLETRDPGRSRWLVMEVFRNWMWIDQILGRQVRKEPRPRTSNLMRLAVAELLNRATDKHARVVHHAVQSGKAAGLSVAECGFVNAVLRSLIREQALSVMPDMRLTHPAWLVRRWEQQFGQTAAMELIRWNQSVPELAIRADSCPGYAVASRWEGFFLVQPGRFAEALDDLKTGRVYVQDPFTRIPVELLAVGRDEHVLDLCAAPGGKTRLLAEALAGTGVLVAVDKPGRRLQRLQENLEMSGFSNIRMLGGRVEDLDQQQLQPVLGRRQADAVLIDVPCSNSGVIQKRPDVKLRLQQGDFARHAAQQLRLLGHAAGLVRPGGRLVYSTCSIDTEENSGVVEEFLSGNPDWRLTESRLSYPWDCNHDGGAAFLLTRAITE